MRIRTSASHSAGRPLRLAASAALLTASAFTAATAVGLDEPDPKSGKALFRQYCAACHGPDARGNGPLTEILVEQPADLTRIAARRDGVFPKPEVLKIIDGRELAAVHGPREMPVWGRQFGEAIPPGPGAEAVKRGTAFLIVDYLASIQEPAEEKAPAN